MNVPKPIGVVGELPSPTREIDFVAYDQLGQPVLLAKAKNTHKTSDPWAARFRSNLPGHGTLPRAPFFLIATPDYMYFWRQEDPRPGEEPPQFIRLHCPHVAFG